MDELILERPADYAFISDPHGHKTFFVERDGEIWHCASDEQWLDFAPISKTVIYNWREKLTGEVKWEWLDGFLSVLVLSGDNGTIQLLPSGEQLFVNFNEECVEQPSNESLPIEVFNEKLANLKEYWDEWFGEGWTPPRNGTFLDNAWKSSMVQVKMTFSGSHPHYGTHSYGKAFHDGFPPTIICWIDTLLDFEKWREARNCFGYWMDRFIRDDGVIDYYGPALSEYGMILWLAAKMLRLMPDGEDWLKERLPKLRSLYAYLCRQYNPHNPSVGDNLLFEAAPEADEVGDQGVFYHNHAHVWRGLHEWSKALAFLGEKSAAVECEVFSKGLFVNIHRSMNKVKDENGLIPSRYENEPEYNFYTDSRKAAYINYRYYPELLEAGILNREDAMKIIEKRENSAGEIQGCTLFGWDDGEKGLNIDNWPLASYARALIELEEKERFLRALWGHSVYALTHDTYTAYEQIGLEGETKGKFTEPTSVPAQLVLPRMLAWSCRYEKWNGELVEWGGPGPIPNGFSK